jgi:hypothetical protein
VTETCNGSLPYETCWTWWTLRLIHMMSQVDLDCHRTESYSGLCELGNEGEEFLGQLCNYKFFRKSPDCKSGRESCDSVTGCPISVSVTVLQLFRIWDAYRCLPYRPLPRSLCTGRHLHNCISNVAAIECMVHILIKLIFRSYLWRGVLISVLKIAIFDTNLKLVSHKLLHIRFRYKFDSCAFTFNNMFK